MTPFDFSAWRGRLAALAITMACLIGGNAAAQQGWDQAPGASDAPKVGARSGPIDPYTRAMLLKQKGQYSDAIPLLQALAEQGRGFEIAQMELGKCYFDLGGRAATPDEAQKSRTLGLSWILKAAESGLGTAEEELVRIYLDGNGIPPDRLEAAKWYLLWRRNPSRMQIGANQFDATLEGRLKNIVQPAGWQDAEQRAKTFRPS